jgi:hypothetical protein
VWLLQLMLPAVSVPLLLQLSSLVSGLMKCLERSTLLNTRRVLYCRLLLLLLLHF